MVSSVSPMMARLQEGAFQATAVESNHLIPPGCFRVSGKQNASVRVVNANDDAQVVPLFSSIALANDFGSRRQDFAVVPARHSVLFLIEREIASAAHIHPRRPRTVG